MASPTQFLGSSVHAQIVRQTIEVIAGKTTTILLRGETGVGKEVVATLIHQKSPRAKRPFVVVDCPAITETLAESEFFGHSKGSFTGATDRRQGLFKEADGGTLFLDEIGDMHPNLQAKLLRVLGNGTNDTIREVRSIGTNAADLVDARVIAATNQNLEQLVREGRFRKDLFFRLNGYTLRLPSLRERPEDVPELAEDFANTQGLQISPEAILKLQKYEWPGNVRELYRILEAASIAAELRGGPEILAEDLVFQDASTEPLASDVLKILLDNTPLPADFSLVPEVKKIRKEIEAAFIARALKQCHWNRRNAAQLLKVSYKKLLNSIPP